MYDQTPVYFDAALYACEVLGVDAPKYFTRLQQLSRYNSSEELRAIIDSWCPKESRPAPKAPPAGSWAAGAAWGESTRVQSESGIIWKLRCACGKMFTLSTGDTVPQHLRKCDSCILADEFSETRREAVSLMDKTSKIVLEWHRAHDKLIWNRVHKACAKRGVTDPEFKRELHALCWAKIADKVALYRDQGFKVSAWLGRVADNAIKDYFKVNDNRSRLAPTVPMIAEDSRDAAAPATKPEEVLPAKAVRPEGASPHDEAENSRQSDWDKGQGWNG